MSQGKLLSKGSKLTDEQISKLAIFAGVEPQDIRSWVDQSNIECFEPGTILLGPHQMNNSVFVVLEGSVGVHVVAPDNDPVSFIEEGQFIGELSVLKEIQPNAFAKTCGNVTALILSKASVLEMVDQVHGVTKNLLSVLCDRFLMASSLFNKAYELQEQHKESSHLDALTKLYNRRWIDAFFRREFDGANSADHDASVILLDVDHFKAFNDTHGHVAGDLALQCVAATMQECLRPTDFAARYGGEEFMLIFPKTPIRDAVEIGQRLRESIAKTVISDESVQYPFVTASLGVAHLANMENVEAVIAAADQALYQAKQDGRDCVRVA